MPTSPPAPPADRGGRPRVRGPRGGVHHRGQPRRRL